MTFLLFIVLVLAFTLSVITGAVGMATHYSRRQTRGLK